MKITRLLSLLLVLTGVNAQDQSPQSIPSASPKPSVVQTLSGGGQAAESAFHLIRSTSGTKVTQTGSRFVVEDPRTVFYIPGDKEVSVYFTIEGPVGPHHFEGTWKKPSGKVSVVSEFDYTAQQRRYGGYFGMLLGDAPVPGLWSLEISVDGEIVGVHTFQVVNTPRPDTPAAAPAGTTVVAPTVDSRTVASRSVLSPADIYKLAAAASVFIENLSATGERRSLSSGFYVAPDRLITSFQAIDGASKVRLITPDGERFEVADVLEWNRRQDWIVLQVPSHKGTILQRAADKSAIGDRVFVLDAAGEGNRVLIDTSLIGKQTVPESGERFTIGDNLSRRTLGSPVLNEYGEVAGVIGGNLISTAAFIEDLVYSSRQLTGTLRGTLAVPINLVGTSANPTPTTIEKLALAGLFTPPLVGNEDVLSGTLSRDLNRKTDPPQAIQERSEFTRQDLKAMLLITWLPKQKRKGVPTLRVYDLDNHLLSENLGKKKISVSPQKLSYSAWELGLASLKPGSYRVDVLLDKDTVWRTFFRIAD